MSVKMDNIYYSTFLGTLSEVEQQDFELTLQGTLYDYYSGRNVIYFRNKIYFEEQGTVLKVYYRKKDTDYWFPISSGSTLLQDFTSGSDTYSAYTYVSYYRGYAEVVCVVFTNVAFVTYEIIPQTYEFKTRLIKTPMSLEIT